MGVKQTQDVPKTLPQDQGEGVDEDEWVRDGGRVGGKDGRVLILCLVSFLQDD